MDHVENEKNFPRVFYGLHAAAGVAEYTNEETKENYRILLPEDTLKKMDPTFPGKPIFFHHVDKIDLENIKSEAEGYVVESFLNQPDGRHWVKFIATTDEALEHIARGEKLSNAYKPTKIGPPGQWHNVDYSQEINDGEYTHLVITPDPRYEESLILTPEEFKKYNEEKLKEIDEIKNEKGEKPMFNFFKKELVKNSKELEGISLQLPKSKKEVSLEQIINEADERAEKGEEGYADLEHKVKTHDGSVMNVGELLEKHKELSNAYDTLKQKCDEMEKGADDKEKPEGDKPKENVSPEDDEKAKKELLQLAEHEQEEIETAKQKTNEKETALKAKIASLRSSLKISAPVGKTPEQIKNDKVAADALRAAGPASSQVTKITVETDVDRLERGRKLFGR
jgi:hypothetical protein